LRRLSRACSQGWMQASWPLRFLPHFFSPGYKTAPFSRFPSWLVARLPTLGFFITVFLFKDAEPFLNLLVQLLPYHSLHADISLYGRLAGQNPVRNSRPLFVYPLYFRLYVSFFLDSSDNAPPSLLAHRFPLFPFPPHEAILLPPHVRTVVDLQKEYLPHPFFRGPVWPPFRFFVTTRPPPRRI